MKAILEEISPGSLAHRGITFAVMLATIMQALDATIANVALPRMQGSLAATQDQMSWVLTSYIVASAIAIPLVGWLSGRIGRKVIFLASIAGFTVASILCGAATTLFEAVLFRLLQGACGAALVPISQAILFDINTRERHGRAMALWGIGVTVGPILGPALGGWLTETYNWRWVFYINVPIGILAFLMLWALLPESPKVKKHFDFFGFLALSIGVGALQLMLDRGELQDWFGSWEIITYAVATGLGFYWFIVHTLTVKHPFLEPMLFKDRNFMVSNFFIFAVGIVLFATLALIPPMLQNQLNYPVITTGLVIAPRGIGTMVGMFVVSRLIGKIDSKYIISSGMLLIVISLHMMTKYSLLMGSWSIISAGVIQGFGIGLVYVPLSSVAFSTLPVILRNEGTAFFNLIRNIGASIGISIVQILLVRNTQTLHASLGEHILPYRVGMEALYTSSHIDMNTDSGMAYLNYFVTNQAQMIAYLDDFQFMMLATLVVMPLIFLLRTDVQATTQEVIVHE